MLYVRVYISDDPNFTGHLILAAMKNFVNFSYVNPEKHYDFCKLSNLTTKVFRGSKVLSIVGVDIPIDHSFQNYQNVFNY